jgi:hypothetical protein
VDSYIGSEEGLGLGRISQPKSRNEEMFWANWESPCRKTERRAGSGERERERQREKNWPFRVQLKDGSKVKFRARQDHRLGEKGNQRKDGQQTVKCVSGK